MGTSVVPALIDALVTAFQAAMPTVSVRDGFTVTGDTGDFLMVGSDDPDSETSAESATVEQAWAHANSTARDERGEVNCVALSWNGDTNQKTVRDSVYAIVAAVENVLRADPTVGGVPGLLYTGFGTSQTLRQNQFQEGVDARLAFTIAFRARI